MENSLSALLERLSVLLENNQSPLCKIFQNGLSRKEIDEQIQNLEISLLPEMYDLYEWKNGVDEEALEGKTLGEIWLFSMGLFPPLNSAIKDYSIGRRWWDKYHFPIFESGGGDYFLIDLDKTRVTYGILLYDSPSDVDFEGIISMFDSLSTLMKGIIECYERKAYYYDLSKEPNLFIDHSLEKEIFRKHNPKSEYWKLFV